MIEEAAATGLVVERPAERVLDIAFLEILFRHGPELFQADAVFLRIAVLGEVEFLYELLRERATCAFSEEDIFAEQFHAGLIVGLVAAIGGNAHDACDDAFHFTGFTIDNVRGRKSRKHVHAEILSFLAEPAGHICE